MPALKNLKKKGATHVRKNITVQRVKKNRKRKSCAVENKENSVNKTIIDTNTQSGSDIGGNIGSDDSGLGNAVNISCSVKKSTILMLVIHYD